MTPLVCTADLSLPITLMDVTNSAIDSDKPYSDKRNAGNPVSFFVKN
jgi:hypothetical protein